MSVESTKHQLIAFLDAHRRDLIDFTCKLVATPSSNPPGDERAVADVVIEKLRLFGLNHAEIAAKVQHRPNVLCRLPGSAGSPVLLFNGHTDTKPVGEEARGDWKTDPLKPGDRIEVLWNGVQVFDGPFAGVLAIRPRSQATTRPSGS